MSQIKDPSWHEIHKTINYTSNSYLVEIFYDGILKYLFI